MSVSTQFAASSIVSPRSLWIPPELISLILFKLWEAPLSSDERSASLQNIVLVNRTWLSLIAPIACRDAHLFNHGNANNFITSLQNFGYHRDLYTTEANRFVHESCRSITVHANGNPQRADLSDATPAFWESFGINQAIHCAMAGVYRCKSLPNLRHVSLRYTDWVYDDIVLQAEYGYFPRQVTHLSVDYSFTAPASAPSFESPAVLKWARRRYPSTCFAARIKRLSLSGTGMSMAFVAIMLLVCPKVETLEITNPAQLTALAPLPLTVRTLVLWNPGVAVCKETMASWALDAALNVGLFPKGSDSKPRRIIVRSGTPDPVAFTELKRTCQREFGVELVYERDDSRTRIRVRQHERAYSIED